MQEQILRYLKQHPAPQLLWVSAAAPPKQIKARHQAPEPGMRTRLQGEHFDCAVLQDLPGPLDKAEAEALVAQLRDVTAQRILWLLEFESPWERQDLLALGFRQLDKSDSQRLYGYDIGHYKTTPDWLNPRHWANPELWNKFRW